MKIFVMIPTYNEKENIVSLLEQLDNLKIKDLEIVVVDDNSPDGTAKLVSEVSSKRKNVHIIVRKEQRGRGYAGKDGFIYCLNKGADVVIEMDADLSHDPKYVPSMLEELESADMVLGSRRVKGSKEVGRGIIRRFITWGANLYIRIMLGVKVRDCNSGFRCFKRKVLESIQVEKLKAKGPDIVQEVLFKAHLKKFKIKEIPITFVNRKKGRSKLGLKQLAWGYWIVLRLKIQSILGKV